MSDDMDRVVPLDQLNDFRVADGDPDVRGWEVLASDGRRIGEVDELLIDTNAMKVRYLDVEVEDGLMAEPDRHVLVPIGYARLDRDRDCVVVDNVASGDLRAMPAYDHAPLTRDFETRVRDSWDGGRAASTGLNTGGAADDFYADTSFDDRRFFGRAGREEGRITRSEEELEVGRREMRAGEVGLEKRVETERVREEVPLRREEVTLERRPISDGLSAAGRGEIGEEEVRIPLHEEQAVVEKRVVPKEELVVRKHEVVENQPVEAELRKERVEVREEGNVRGEGLRADAARGDLREDTDLGTRRNGLDRNP